MLVTTVVIGNILHFSVVVVLFNGHYMPLFPTKNWVSLRFCIAHMSLMSHGCLVYSDSGRGWRGVLFMFQNSETETRVALSQSRLLSSESSVIGIDICSVAFGYSDTSYTCKGKGARG